MSWYALKNTDICGVSGVDSQGYWHPWGVLYESPNDTNPHGVLIPNARHTKGQCSSFSCWYWESGSQMERVFGQLCCDSQSSGSSMFWAVGLFYQFWTLEGFISSIPGRGRKCEAIQSVGRKCRRDTASGNPVLISSVQMSAWCQSKRLDSV